MNTSAEKSSHTTSAPEHQKSAQPFFPKAGGGDFFAPAIQTKLTVNKPGDKFEQEADKMADKVMRMPAPAPPEKEEKIQRTTMPEEKVQKATLPEEKIQKATQPEEKIQKQAKEEEKVQKATLPEEKIQKKEEEKIQKANLPEEKIQNKEEDKIQKAALPEEKVQKKEEDKIQKATLPEEKVQKKEEEKLQRKSGDGTPAVATDTQSAIKSKTSGGQPLSSETRSYMEPRFGADFNNVRVHNDQESAGLNNQLGARAFTYQNHVFFSNGQYQPETSDGKHLLAHELTHTIQQGHSAETPVQRSGVSGVQRLPAPAGAIAKGALTSSQVVDISGNTFTPSAKIKEEIEAQGDKGLEVRVVVNGLTAEGRVKVRVDGKGNYSSIGKGSMAIQNEWMQQLGGMYLNFSIKNNDISGGYASLKPGGGDTNDWLQSVKKNVAVLGGLGLKVDSLPTPVNIFENGKLTLGVTGMKVEVGGFVDAQFNLLLENANKPKIDATAEVNIKGMVQGKLILDNTKDKLSGEVSLAVNYKSFSGAGKVKYNADGTVDVDGKGAYNANKLSGEVQFVATDLESANKFAKDAIAAAGGKENVQNAAAPAPVPAAKPGSKQRAIAATGQLAFNLTTWFAGTVNVVVDGKGNITVIGKIAPPAEIELFKQRDWDKELIKFEAKAYYGIPVVGNLNLFANISLHALAKLGPAKIYNIEILGTYSTDPEVQKNIQISGSINISAYAGLRLRAEGGAGIEILSHDLKFGVGLNADIGVKAYADARPTIGYRDPGVFYISGTLEMVAQPMLGLGGDFFIAIETPWWSPLSDDRWTWPLFSKEWPLTDPIGLSATVKDYVLGSGQAPEIEMKKPEFDPSKFMTSMVDKTLPEKSGGKGEGKGTFKEDGSVPKPDVAPKKAAPKAPDIKLGKKGTTPKGDKSKAPDPKGAKELDTGKMFKKTSDLLSALKGKEPYTRVDLDKELSKIKGQVSGLDLDVKQKGDKWVVTPKAGGKLAKKGVELAMKKDGAISDEAKKGIAALDQVTVGYASKGATEEEMTAAVKSVRRKFKFKSIEIEQKNGFWYYNYEINPKDKLKGPGVIASSSLVLVPFGSWIENLKTKSFERVTNQSNLKKRKVNGEMEAVSFLTTKPDGGVSSFLYSSEGAEWKRTNFTHKSKYVIPEGGSSAGFILIQKYRGSEFIRPNFYEDSRESRKAIVKSKLPPLLNPSNSKQFLSEAPASLEAGQGYTQTLNGKALIPIDVASPDHDPPIAEHWSKLNGNKTNHDTRKNWNKNLNTYKLMSLKLNLSLGSRGETYTEKAGIEFLGPGE